MKVQDCACSILLLVIICLNNYIPFDKSSVQAVFQCVMFEIFQDFEGVEVLVQDILVWT